MRAGGQVLRFGATQQHIHHLQSQPGAQEAGEFCFVCACLCVCVCVMSVAECVCVCTICCVCSTRMHFNKLMVFLCAQQFNHTSHD